MATFITSDTHIGHEHKDQETGEIKGIIPYTGRPWKNVAEMAEGLRDNFGATLKPDDELIVVGDAVMGDRNQNLKWFGGIPGRKTLVMGNHDHIHPMFNKDKRNHWFPVYAQYFDVIVQEMDLDIQGIDVILNHFPYDGDHSETRYNAEKIDMFRPKDEGLFLLHGHIHAEEIMWGERQIHVGLDADYTAYGVERYHPIPIEVIHQVILDNS